MRLSIVVSTPDAEFEALAFRDDFRDSIGKIAALGYPGVELALRDPDKVDHGEIVRLISDHNQKVTALGTGQAYGQEGLSFSHPESGVRDRAVERIERHVELAAKLGAYVIIGLIRGTAGAGRDRNRCLEWVRSCLKKCARMAGDHGVSLVIEPLNRYETNLINTADEAVTLIHDIACPNVGLLLDSFHMNIEEVSMTETIRRCAAYLKHFHVADSNRWAPGFGHLDFLELVTALRESGYAGYLSAEIIPAPDPETAARQTLLHLSPLIERVEKE